MFDADLVVFLDNTKRLLTTEGFTLVAPELFFYVELARAALAGVAPPLEEITDYPESLDD